MQKTDREVAYVNIEIGAANAATSETWPVYGKTVEVKAAHVTTAGTVYVTKSEAAYAMKAETEIIASCVIKEDVEAVATSVAKAKAVNNLIV